MLKQIVESMDRKSKTSIRTLKKILKDKGQIEIIMGATDTWAMIDDIDGDYGYGMDQFDKDIEINLKTGDYKVTK